MKNYSLHSVVVRRSAYIDLASEESAELVLHENGICVLGILSSSLFLCYKFLADVTIMHYPRLRL